MYFRFGRHDLTDSLFEKDYDRIDILLVRDQSPLHGQSNMHRWALFRFCGYHLNLVMLFDGYTYIMYMYIIRYVSAALDRIDSATWIHTPTLLIQIVVNNWEDIDINRLLPNKQLYVSHID